MVLVFIIPVDLWCNCSIHRHRRCQRTDFWNYKATLEEREANQGPFQKQSKLLITLVKKYWYNIRAGVWTKISETRHRHQARNWRYEIETLEQKVQTRLLKSYVCYICRKSF